MKKTTLLAVGMISAALAVSAYAMNGTGSAADPYLIGTEADFLSFAAAVNDGSLTAVDHVRLTDDLDFSGLDYVMVGTAEHPFIGHFDGDGYVLRNIVIDTAPSEFYCETDVTKLLAVGAFAYVRDAEITDVSVENVSISLTEDAVTIRAGLLCGDYMTDTSSAANGIFRCGAQGELYLNTYKTTYGGGLVGYVYTTEKLATAYVEDCFADVTMQTGGRYSVFDGGIVAKIDEEALYSEICVKRCVAKMSATVLTDVVVPTHPYAAGIVGYSNVNSEWQKKNGAKLSAETDEVQDCVVLSFKASPRLTGVTYFGDAIGFSNDSAISNCFVVNGSAMSTGALSKSGKAVGVTELYTTQFLNGLGFDLQNVWYLDQPRRRLMLRRAIMPAEPQVISLSYRDGMLSGELDYPFAPQDCQAFLALYDENGRFTDTLIFDTVEDDDEAPLPHKVFDAVPVFGKPVYAVLMFMDMDKLQPLCEPYYGNVRAE